MSALNQEASRKRKRLKKRYFLMLLLLLFGTGFLVGKSYSARELPSTPEEPTIIPELNEKTEKTKPEKEESTNEETDKNDLVEEEKDGKVVYLTFDDGPSKLTEQFLDILQDHGVKATFFMQGSNLKKEHLQNSVKRAAKEGHYIGAHSMTHNYKKLYTDQQFVPEMIQTLELVQEITGLNHHLVRPPYGSAPGLKSELMRKQLADAHIKVWDWTIDSHDWELAGKPSQILQNIKQGTTTDREIVLMHEKQQTLEALPGILKFFKEQEYAFAVYDETHHFELNFQNDSDL